MLLMLWNHLTSCFLSFFSFGFFFHFLFFFLSLSFEKLLLVFSHWYALKWGTERDSANFSSRLCCIIFRLALQRRCSIEIISSLHVTFFTRTLSDHEVLIEFKWAKCLQRAWQVCLKLRLTQCSSSLCVLCSFAPGKPVSCLMVYLFRHLISPCPSRPG